MPGIQHSHLPPVIPGGLASEQPFGNGMRLAVIAHALAHHRLHALASAVFRHQDCLFVTGAQTRCADHVGGELAREAQYLRGVAVIHLEHRGASGGFDAELLPHRAFAPFVDRLRIVVNDHQRLRVRVHHLRRQRQPLRLEIVRLVDQHRIVLPAGNQPALCGIEHGLHVGGIESVAVGEILVIEGGEAILAQHPETPGMESRDDHLVLHAAILHRVFQPPGNTVRIAQDQHRAARRARDLLGAERQDQRLARTRHAAHDAVTLTHAARQQLLLHVHHFQQAVIGG